MFNPVSPLHYFAVGRSARECIDASLAAAGKADVRQILDFGCGHGRVLRVLRRMFPAAHITASDIDRDGVDFCARRFGAVGVYSDTDAAAVAFEDDFDLIWAGSVFTHIDKEAWSAFLSRLRDSLASDGVLVFTVGGPYVEQKIRSGENDYGLGQPTATSALSDYAASGFGYGDYPGTNGYGIAIASPQAGQRLVEQAGLRMVNYQPKGWDNHQDVYACVRAAN